MNIEDVWYGRSWGSRTIRTTLWPLAALYGIVVRARNGLYDHGLLRTHSSAIAVISVGNVTVGGTGKTPLSAHIVRLLLAQGRKPAVVMRGYGDDELHLHARMNPSVPVVTGADRVAGIREAIARGADIAVLDDAFQHRRASRDLDIVLVSAESWNASARVLPAGPLREPLRALDRADLVIVTQKSASDDDARAVVREIRGRSDVTGDVILARIAPAALVAVRGVNSIPLDVLGGERVLAFAGVGDPSSFFAQLRQLGAVVTGRRFGDHHAYTAADVGRLTGQYAGHKYAVTTEKDAVKLSTLWPATGPELWYLSQAVRITEGEPLLASALAKLFQRATSIA